MSKVDHMFKQYKYYCENLSIDEWREIRAGDYWEIRDSLKYYIDKIEFSLKRINKWKQQ